MNPVHTLHAVLKSLYREREMLEKQVASNTACITEVEAVIKRVEPYFSEEESKRALNEKPGKPRYQVTNKLCPKCQKEYLLRRVDKPVEELHSVHECMYCLAHDFQDKLGNDPWVDPQNPDVEET